MFKFDRGARPTGRAGLTAWYAAALAHQARSGLSVTEFARQLGVSAGTLYEWRRRLGPTGSRVSVAAASTQLVEVKVARPTDVTGSAFVLRLAAGSDCIEVPGSFDADALRRLIAVVESC